MKPGARNAQWPPTQTSGHCRIIFGVERSGLAAARWFVFWRMIWPDAPTPGCSTTGLSACTRIGSQSSPRDGSVPD